MHGYSERDSSICLVAITVLVLLALTAMPSQSKEPWLAIGGYDPVAYFTQSRATRGDTRYEYVWDDARYHFVSAQNRDLFKASPERYAPQFPGYCAMSLVEGVKVEPNPENWLIADGKLYLFGKPIGPERFSANIDQNIALANENWQRPERDNAPAAQQSQ
jgi:YHS domain-containing protein